MATKRQSISKLKKKAAPTEVPVRYYLPDSLHLEVSDNAIVRHTEDGFILLFMQIQHPFAITEEEISQITEVQSKCVASVFLTASRMVNLINALQTNLNIYIEKVKAAQEKTEQAANKSKKEA